MMEKAHFEFADTDHHNLLIPITTVGKMAGMSSVSIHVQEKDTGFE